MHVLVTGASGFIGSATVPELLGAGHTVLGLARSDASAEALEAAGAQVHRATLDDRDSLRAAADGCDGVLHLAFKHDLAFTGDYEGAGRADLAAIAAFGDALAGSDRPLVIANGLAGFAPGRVITEQDLPDPAGQLSPRAVAAARTLELADRGVRSCVVRLPPSVHGEGDAGFVPTLIGIARAQGVSGSIGDGSSRWPAVHRTDAARLFRLALEQAPAGSVLQPIADEGVPSREIAGVIGRHLDLPVVSVPEADAGAHFGWIAPFFGADLPASANLTRELLGWAPTGPALIEDLEQGHYFASA